MLPESVAQCLIGDDPYYRHQGWLSGRVTTDDNFMHYRAPVLDEYAAPVPEGVFVADAHADKYYISIDEYALQHIWH